jgi:hypothetical protein
VGTKQPPNPPDVPPSCFYRNLLFLCSQNKIAISRLGKDIGLSNSATTHWRWGAQPHLATAKIIADKFGVSVDALLNSDLESVPSVSLSTLPAPSQPTLDADLMGIIKSQQETIRELVVSNRELSAAIKALTPKKSL